MKQLIKDIISDQSSFLKIKNGVKRIFPDKYLVCDEIIIISGVRRCGKSVLLQQIREEQVEKNYFFNFDDERLTYFTSEHFQELYEVFVELYGVQKHFYFDEIQNIIGWEKFVRRLYNSGSKVFITGSNARMLSRELGTHLTGCYIGIELFPFSFPEYLSYCGKEKFLTGVSGTVERGTIQSLFDNYLQNGGFPIYLNTSDDNYLKTLYDNILYKDVMVRNRLTNEREIKELMYYISSNIGKPFTYTSLAKVIGIKNPTTIKNYLEYIENTYLLFSISKFDYSVKAQIRNSKKSYLIDNAMVKRLGFHFSADNGRLLENLVFIELRRRGLEVFYSQNKGECDFVVRDGGHSISQVFQVCYSMNDISIEQREIKGVMEAMTDYNLSEGYIITATREEQIKVNNKTIHIIPAWKWLLSIL